MSTKRPNLVLFNPDQMRADVLGHLGNPAGATPVIDHLVESDAVSFRNAYCQSPYCTPSRCSFMTGWYPHVRGHRSMLYMLQPDEPMLLQILKDAGYHVVWAGKNDLVPGQEPSDRVCDLRIRNRAGQENSRGETVLDTHHPRNSSWRELGPDDVGYYSFHAGRLEPNSDGRYPDPDWSDLDDVLTFLRDYDGDEPFCVFFSLQYPHPPYCVEEPYYSAFERTALPPRIPVPDSWEGLPPILPRIADRQNLSSWGEGEWSRLRATYYGMCRRVDDQLGMLIGALQERGFYDDTALFVFADHGDFTGDYGLAEKCQNSFQECLVRVPLIVKPPTGIACSPGIRDTLAELIDIPATVAEIAGVPLAHDHFSRSLVSVLSDDTAAHRDYVCSEGGRLEHESQMVPETFDTEAEFRRFLYWPRISVQMEEPRTHAKGLMVRDARFKYVKRAYGADELYDLETDPTELRNVIGTPSYREHERRLKDIAFDHLFLTADFIPKEIDQR